MGRSPLRFHHARWRRPGRHACCQRSCAPPQPWPVAAPSRTPAGPIGRRQAAQAQDGALAGPPRSATRRRAAARARRSTAELSASRQGRPSGRAVNPTSCIGYFSWSWLDWVVVFICYLVFLPHVGGEAHLPTGPRPRDPSQLQPRARGGGRTSAARARQTRLSHSAWATAGSWSRWARGRAPTHARRATPRCWGGWGRCWKVRGEAGRGAPGGVRTRGGGGGGAAGGAGNPFLQSHQACLEAPGRGTSTKGQVGCVAGAEAPRRQGCILIPSPAGEDDLGGGVGGGCGGRKTSA
jgi:hypothetical protein